MFDYSESLVEGTAVLANYMTTSVTAAAGTLKCGPFWAGNLRRIVFDVTNWAAAATNSTCFFALQGATTSGATAYTIVGPDSNYPSLVSSSFTAGGTITTAMTTALNFVRIEYKAESIRNAIDVYNAGTTSGGTKAGSWVQLALQPVTGTGTFALSVTAYGVGGSGPSADILANKWLTNTSVLCTVTNQFIDGWKLSNTSAFPTAILPY